MVTEQKTQTTGTFAWARWMAGYGALTYIMLGVDAAMNHRDVIHETRWAWTPLIFAPLAFLACLIVVLRPAARRLLWWVGSLSAIVGLAGTYFHLAHPFHERGSATLWHALLTSETPIFAPAAFAGVGLVLLIAAWGDRRQQGPPA